MGNADLHGSGSLRYPSADEWEATVLKHIRRLASDAGKLAKAEKGSGEAVLLKDRMEDDWRDIVRDLAVLRAEERRETKLVARDLMHARLSSFYTTAQAAEYKPPLLSWENAFKGAMLWLARWSGNTPGQGE